MTFQEYLLTASQQSICPCCVPHVHYFLIRVFYPGAPPHLLLCLFPLPLPFPFPLPHSRLPAFLQEGSEKGSELLWGQLACVILKGECGQRSGPAGQLLATPEIFRKINFVIYVLTGPRQDNFSLERTQDIHTSAGALWLSHDLAVEFELDLAGHLTSACSTSSAIKWGHHFLANITGLYKEEQMLMTSSLQQEEPKLQDSVLPLPIT